MSRSFFPVIIETIIKSRETLAEWADIAKDILIKSESFEQIPVFSVAVKALSIKDIFIQERFKKNCYAFIEAIKEAEHEKIEEMRILLENKPELLDDFTDTIMSILIEGHKPIKAHLIGRLIMALAVGEITIEEFQILSQIIQAASVPALISLKSFMDGNNGKLYANGHSLIQEEPLILSTGLASRFGSSFRISDFGHKLYLYGFQGKQSAL